jgi:FkbM family methyltransferase
VERAEGEPRRQPGSIELAGLTVRYPDLATLCPQWHDLFVCQTLRFVAPTPAPRILDGGANVGLASLYLKRLYPRARITAFEADPAIAALLRENLSVNGAGDVEVAQAALWTRAGTVRFRAEGADSGAVASLEGAPPAREIEVPAVRLREILAREEAVDLLKLDIEGAEEEVLEDAEEELARVRCLVVEIHETDPERRRTPALLELLARAGFRYSLDELLPLDGPAPEAGAVPPPFPGAPPRWVIRARAWREGSA